MAQYYIGLWVLLVCFCFEASSRPSNDEFPTTFKVEAPIEDQDTEQGPDIDEERSLPEDDTLLEPQEENTQEILEKIKAINEKLRKPQRQQLNFNPPLYSGGQYILDKAILEKIQQIIASGKLHRVNEAHKQESNLLEDVREANSRALRFVQPELTSNALPGLVSLMPLQYMTNIPVIVTPTAFTGYPTTQEQNYIDQTAQYSTRQRPSSPSLPFQIQWPLAPFFPVLIKDPLLHYLQGGNWQNLIDYGQNADVCTRKQKSAQTEDSTNNEEREENDNNDILLENAVSLNPFIGSSRQGRKIKNLKKRTVSKTPSPQNLGNKDTVSKNSQSAKSSAYHQNIIHDVKNLQNLFQKQTTSKPVKKVEPTQDTKNVNGDEGDLKFPFGDFTFFGNRKPVAPSPGFFINRLKVRRGGVAIAGPGGVATAGRGGTAVVGPGGLAYTQPGGLAVAGPSARVVALSSEADLNSIIARLQQQAATDGSVPRLLQAIPEGKVVATGPVVYYHPYKV